MTDAVMDPERAGPDAPRARSRRAAIGGGIGCVVEGYDFSSYGYPWPS